MFYVEVSHALDLAKTPGIPTVIGVPYGKVFKRFT